MTRYFSVLQRAALQLVTQYSVRTFQFCLLQRFTVGLKCAYVHFLFLVLVRVCYLGRVVDVLQGLGTKLRSFYSVRRLR